MHRHEVPHRWPSFRTASAAHWGQQSLCSTCFPRTHEHSSPFPRSTTTLIIKPFSCRSLTFHCMRPPLHETNTFGDPCCFLSLAQDEHWRAPRSGHPQTDLDLDLYSPATDVFHTSASGTSTFLSRFSSISLLPQDDYHGHEETAKTCSHYNKHPFPLSQPATTLFNQPTRPRPPTFHHIRPPPYQTHSLCDLCCTLPFAEIGDQVCRRARFLWDCLHISAFMIASIPQEFVMMVRQDFKGTAPYPAHYALPAPSSGPFVHPRPSTNYTPTAIPSFGPGAPPSPPSATSSIPSEKPSRRSSADPYPAPADHNHLPTPLLHSDLSSPTNSMSPVTPLDPSRSNAKIVSSTGSNTMQMSSDIISPLTIMFTLANRPPRSRRIPKTT
jgi:hypothetical protein